MKKSLLTLFWSMILTFGQAWGKTSIRNRVLELLPKELSTLSVKDSRRDIEKKLADKIYKKDQPDTLYLNYFDEKNDVSIGTESGKFSYLYVEIPRALAEKQKDLFNIVIDQLTQKQKEKIIKENEVKTNHEKGRFIIINIPDERIKLEFYNNEMKSLHSVIILPEEKKIK